MRTKILLTGAYGQLGWELQRTLSTVGDVISCSRDELDLAQSDSIVHKVRQISPDIIVNAAAYTAVDKAENELELAMCVNGAAPGILAAEAERLGAWMVHYSTDYVFDGNTTRPYTEEMTANPLNAYGLSKLEGEKSVARNCRKHLILRTSWIYGSHGRNFVHTMLKLAKEKKEIAVVGDQIGAPTWSRSLAQMTVQLLMLVGSETASEQFSGIYHVTSSGETSWYEFARSIFQLAGIEVQLKQITSQEYVTAAKRPQYSVLSNQKLLDAFNQEMPSWETALKLYMEPFS